jgi:hypothetical protein
MRFNPFGIPEPAQPERNASADAMKARFIEFAREAGLIPRDVPPQNIHMKMIAVNQSTGEVTEMTEEPVVDDGYDRPPWRPGEQLPHTSFDDPPYQCTADEWRDRLINGARVFDDPEMFEYAMMESLGADMVHSHDVPIDVAMVGCKVFAQQLYEKYHDASS